MSSRALRIAVIAPVRFPIRRPHAGGLESAVWWEVETLRRRGHEVTLVAVTGSDSVQPGSDFALPALDWPAGSHPTDSTYPPGHAQRSLPALDHALSAIAADAGSFDVIANHCLDALPLWRAPELGVPMVTTLHTPPDRQSAAAHRAAGGAGSIFLSVSEHTRRLWARAGVPSTVLSNGIDPATWPQGPGGDALVWFGRIVPEKAPHLAIEVAQALGRELVIAGRIGDSDYADAQILPRLGAGVRWTGPLAPAQLAHLVGSSAVSLSTPAWAEPFGLVAPEALMCGTPVVSFAVGGVPEVAHGGVGMELVDAGDVGAMATRAESLLARQLTDPTFRRRIRRSAVARFSLERRMDVLIDLLRAISTGPRTLSA